jgi:hypothetical protein
MAATTRRWAPVSLFYPLAFALIVAMVVMALKPGLDRTRAWRASLRAIAAQGLVIEGEQLNTIVVNERATAEVEGPADGRYAVIGSDGVVTSAQNSGARYWLPADAVRELRGKEVSVGLEVRSDPVKGAEDWLVRVAIRGVLDTGWLPQRTEEDWTVAQVPVAIPPNDRNEPMEIIMWSDSTGDEGRIHLRRIEIEPVALDGTAP